MSRTRTVLSSLAALLIAAPVVAWFWRNPEVATLDAEARAGAPGAFVTLSDGITHYEDTGPKDARVAVLVHGSSVPYYIWDSTTVALRGAGYRVIRYDLFGRGYSDRPDGAYDAAFDDRQLSELLDSLHVVGPIDLMGVSYGGVVTGHFVAKHAERVRTLTLIDPAASSRALPSVMTTPVIGEWLWQVLVAPNAAAGQPGDFLHPERWPNWVARYEPQMRYRGFGRSLRRSAIANQHTDWQEHYAAVGRTGIPVLLVWGKQDATVSISLSNVVRDGIPDVEYFPVDSAGHLPMIEQSAVVHARILFFLADHATQEVPPE